MAAGGARAKLHVARGPRHRRGIGRRRAGARRWCAPCQPVGCDRPSRPPKSGESAPRWCGPRSTDAPIGGWWLWSARPTPCHSSRPWAFSPNRTATSRCTSARRTRAWMRTEPMQLTILGRSPASPEPGRGLRRLPRRGRRRPPARRHRSGRRLTARASPPPRRARRGRHQPHARRPHARPRDPALRLSVARASDGSAPARLRAARIGRSAARPRQGRRQREALRVVLPARGARRRVVACPSGASR